MTQKTLLVVDDEALFTESLAAGLQSMDAGLRVVTAHNGTAAQKVLGREHVDLVLTDLKMPGGDGFSLIAFLNEEMPQVPVLVMTAFGTPEIGLRLEKMGVPTFVEKPLDLKMVHERIITVLDSAASGYVQGISLPTFLQIIEMERKTCTLRIEARSRTGTLDFDGGVLVDAATGNLTGEEAAREIVRWEQTSIAITKSKRRVRRRIVAGLGKIMLDSFRELDETAARHPRENNGSSSDESGDDQPAESLELPERKEENMSVQEKLKELSSIDGFIGAGLYTPTGDSLGTLAGGTAFAKEIGVLANNVLRNAQQATLEMGAGRGQQVHIEGEKAHVLARCLNEGTDPLQSQPGKAHVHLVLALANDSAIGMAKLRVSSVLLKLADEVRA